MQKGADASLRRGSASRTATGRRTDAGACFPSGPRPAAQAPSPWSGALTPPGSDVRASGFPGRAGGLLPRPRRPQVPKAKAPATQGLRQPGPTHRRPPPPPRGPRRGFPRPQAVSAPAEPRLPLARRPFFPWPEAASPPAVRGSARPRSL